MTVDEFNALVLLLSRIPLSQIESLWLNTVLGKITPAPAPAPSENEETHMTGGLGA